MLSLPFLKQRRWPRVATPENTPEPKMVNASYQDQLFEHVGGELMQAIHEKNPKQLRSALEALARHVSEERSDG